MRIFSARSIACLAVLAYTAACQTEPRQIVQLNQGWSEHEIEFYNHGTEGTNLAPLDFVLNLPDPEKPGSRFVDKLSTAYGFIPSDKSALNPHGLPVGFAIDSRTATVFKDRVYAGITCAACHTRQLTFSTMHGGRRTSFILPVHGGPGLVDFARFKSDFYNAFFALLKDDNAASDFARRVLGRTPVTGDIAALRDEIKEFTGPVEATLAVIQAAKVSPADFGPGNLNALTQGNYNNMGLARWLRTKGVLPQEGTPAAPSPWPRFEGTNNFPPLWFAHKDTWAQWFAEIHHIGARNWVQSLSSSEVRPPGMIKALGPAVVIGSIHFDNIAEIQRSLELLRTPKWPEAVLGPLDRALVEEGRDLYKQHCAKCHTRGLLPPNDLGIVFSERPAFDVGTDPTAYKLFAEDADNRAKGLTELSNKIIGFRQAQLEKRFGRETADNHMKHYSRGRPNQFGVAKDQYKAGEAKWPKSGAAYWASPLEGIFASAPYFHNGSVRTLQDLLTPPEERPRTFRTGTTEFDVQGIGVQSAGPFVYDTTQPGKGNGGHAFGTDLPKNKKAALIEYLKSL